MALLPISMNLFLVAIPEDGLPEFRESSDTFQNSLEDSLKCVFRATFAPFLPELLAGRRANPCLRRVGLPELEFDGFNPPLFRKKISSSPILAPKNIFSSSKSIRIKVNIPATEMRVYVADTLIRSYRLSVGLKSHPTPIENFLISNLIWNPEWIPPADSAWARSKKRTPPNSKDNPLGLVKMPLGNGILIHGTKDLRSLSRARSHGCLRLSNRDAVELAWNIQNVCSGKQKPALVEQYLQNATTSFKVHCTRSIPVRIKYQEVELRGDRLWIYFDPYQHSGLKDELKKILSTVNSRIRVDNNLVTRLDYLRKRSKQQGREAFVISLTELKELQDFLNLPFRPALEGLAQFFISE